MKIAFVTNFYNHHQKPLADALYSQLGDNYFFIETAPITEERLNMGWGQEEIPSYVLKNYKDEESRIKCQEIIDTADVVILGSAPYSTVKNRLKHKKLTFLYTERIYKTGVPILKLPLYFLRNIKKYNRHKSFYVLCASAYTALDFSRTLSFINKTYKWGYFTEFKEYPDIDDLIGKKDHHSILWCARLIPLKHPEAAIEIAKLLKKDGYQFKLSLIGSGELENSIKELIASNELGDCVELLGSMTPDKVRAHMEKSELFLFNSDRNEGWGAVLNESMNSACAVVASDAIGSVPFLINDGENGYMYQDGNINDLYLKVKKLLDDETLRKSIAKKAYQTMANEWNAENAAKKLLYLTDCITSGKKNVFPFESGVCSKAKILKKIK